MATKKTTSKQKAATRKVAAKTTAAKATAGKTAAKADKPNRVFAIRVTDDELAAIHEAAGPRNATRFIRATAAAFAGDDTKAFQAVLAEAKQARAATA